MAPGSGLPGFHFFSFTMQVLGPSPPARHGRGAWEPAMATMGHMSSSHTPRNEALHAAESDLSLAEE